MGHAHFDSLEHRRLFATYTPDVTFGSDGTLVVPTDAAPFVAVRDGGILVGGLVRNATYGPELNISRFHADGTPDRDYNGGPKGFDVPRAVIELVGADASSQGFYTGSTGNTAFINRLRITGSRDPGFAAQLTPPDSALKTTTVDQVQPLPGGGVLAVVRVSGGSRVVTYLAKLGDTGRLDTGFGVNGYAFIARTAGDAGPAVWIQADTKGRIYFTAGQPGVSRLRANGSLDKGFDSDGSTGDFAVNPAAALDADGRLVILDPAMRTVRRFDTTGRDDLTFDGDGQAAPVLIPRPDEPIGVFPQPDGLIYAQAGRTVARFKADGTLDTRFDTDGLARLPTAGQILAVLPGGQFLQRYGDEIKAVGRLKNVALGASGTLYVTGESASDTVDIRTTSRAVNVTFGSVLFTFKKAAVSRIETRLGRGNNVFTSTAALPSLVVTADGYDRVTTGNADDSIYSGGGSDRILSYGGDDRLHPGPGNNSIDGGDGTDIYYGESTTDTFANIEDSRLSVVA